MQDQMETKVAIGTMMDDQQGLAPAETKSSKSKGKEDKVCVVSTAACCPRSSNPCSHCSVTAVEAAGG